MAQYGNMEIAIPGLLDSYYPFFKSTRCAKQDIQYGKPVMGYLDDVTNGYNYALDTSKIVWDADFVTSNLIDIVVNGVTITQVPFNTDHDTTMDDVVTQVTAKSITDSVLGVVTFKAALDATDANNRTLYIRTTGLDSTVTEAVTAGATQATGTITTQSDQVLIGGAVFLQREVAASTGAKYYVNDDITVIEQGRIWMYANSATGDGIAYIDNAGADKGNFANAAGDTVNTVFRSLKITNADTTDDLALVEFFGIKKINAVLAWV